MPQPVALDPRLSDSCSSPDLGPGERLTKLKRAWRLSCLLEGKAGFGAS